MANPENLRPYKKGELSSEEAKKRGSKGGKASVKVRREKKAMQELVKWVMELPVKDADLDEITCISKTKGKNVTVAEAAILQQAVKAVNGSLQALQFLRDTAGEKPVERMEVNADVAKAEAEIAAMIAKRKASGDG
ncbi:MAG: hypothetical protein RSG23_05105 [Gordonibacter sp.]